MNLERKKWDFEDTVKEQSSCSPAQCTVRPNKLKCQSLEQRKVYCRAEQKQVARTQKSLIVFLGKVFFFNINLFNWRLITLQYCIGFAIHQHESATDTHVFPMLNPPPSSLPVPSLWVISVHQPQASSIMHRTWTGDSFHIWYYTCFNAILPYHPTLSLSHRVQNTILYICVSFAVSHTGLSLPSF